LFKKFPKIFGLIEASPSPVLIEINNTQKSNLLSEQGLNPYDNFKTLKTFKVVQPEKFDLLAQQTNFKLINPVEPKDLVYWLINVTEWKHFNSEFNLYELNKVI
jgi:hypothetical protein